eukprot:1768616-Pleurochrysis_carterae.AAC.1
MPESFLQLTASTRGVVDLKRVSELQVDSCLPVMFRGSVMQPWATAVVQRNSNKLFTIFDKDGLL